MPPKKRYGVKRRGSFKHSYGSRIRYKGRISAWGAGPLGGTSVSSRYAGKGKPSQVLVRAPQSGPDRVFVKLKKVFRGNLDTGASGAFANYPILCNNGIDPFGTLGAGGAVGFASWCGNGAGQYLAYCVHAFAVKLSCTQPAGTSGTHIVMSFKSAAQAAPTDTMQVAGSARAKSLLMAAGTEVHTMYSYHSVAECYAQTNQTVASDDTFSALYNAAPASEVRCDISVQGTASTLNNIPVVLELTQYIEFFGRQADAVPS